MSAGSDRRRSTVRRLGALAVAAAMAATLPAFASAQVDTAAAEQAAREIQAARDRANAASQAMFDAESTLDELSLAIVDAERELASVEAQADSMRSSLEAGAQRAFANSGATNPLFVDLDDANDGITADRQASVARGAASVELDDFDAVMDEVDAKRADLERQQDATAAARERYEQLKQAAENEVVELTRIEEQRLQDEQVRIALERERQRRLEQERAAAASAAAASSAAAARQAASSGGAAAAPTPAPSQGSSNGAAPAPAPAPSPAPAPAPAPPSPPPSNAGSGIVCPVAGPHAFADTWGAPRSGGRSHQGVDMMASRGTPLVAVESGYAQFKTTRLGGNSVWVNGASGTRYFYAHLSAWEGSSRNVSRGEVIGYVGATGNTSANHLHFEVHPGGGRAVNPYPYVRAVC